MMICETSQGSTSELSVYTRMPSHPYSSLHRATSTTVPMYTFRSTRFEAGQVENTATDVRDASSTIVPLLHSRHRTSGDPCDDPHDPLSPRVGRRASRTALHQPPRLRAAPRSHA